jgi:hypothetical protein
LSDYNLETLCQVQDPELDEMYYDVDFDHMKSLSFDMLELLDVIGKNHVSKNDFEITYKMVIDGIRAASIDDQKNLCLDILSKFSNEFDYIFTPMPVLDSQDEFNTVYKLIYFVHSSFINYIHYCLEPFDYHIVMSNVLDFQFLQNNSSIIFEKLDDIAELLVDEDESLIRQFLIYDNNSILEIIDSHIRENKTQIVANLVAIKP